MAAALWCGNDALLSFGTASELLRLPFTAKEVHVTVPRAVNRASTEIVVHQTLELIDRDRFFVDGLPCTAPARTIIDLAAVVDAEQLEHLIDTARRLGLTTTSVLARRAEELRAKGRSGSSAVGEAIRSVNRRPTESRLEVKVARLLRNARLRPEANQHRVGRSRLDFAWPSVFVAVECDGFEWHGNRLAWKRDRRRLARLELLGWRIVPVTWEDVSLRPDETLFRIRLALRQ
jgi:very-short-patch-repair endonuclease